MSNSLDPDQARGFVGPALGPNCLPRLSADDTGRQRVKRFYCVKCDLAAVFDLHLKHVLRLSHKLKLRTVITHYYD